MDLEQAVHQRWAESQELAALLPPEKVTTGRAAGGAVPYATIRRGKGRPAVQTNAGVAAEEITVRVHVWHEDYDAARAIAEQVKATFDGSDLELAGGENVARMRRTADLIREHGDGLWQFVIEFLIQVCSPQAT